MPSPDAGDGTASTATVSTSVDWTIAVPKPALVTSGEERSTRMAAPALVPPAQKHQRRRRLPGPERAEHRDTRANSIVRIAGDRATPVAFAHPISPANYRESDGPQRAVSDALLPFLLIFLVNRFGESGRLESVFAHTAAVGAHQARLAILGKPAAPRRVPSA
jgi:hypothetical protein